MKNYILDEFINNSDGTDNFILYYEEQHEKESKLPQGTVENNYDEIKEIMKSVVTEIVSNIK